MDKPKHILIVEDDSTVRELMRDALELFGYQTYIASNGTEALGLLKSTPAIDLLVTDQGLPDIQGTVLATKALEQKPALKVLIASGYIQNQRLLSSQDTPAPDSSFHLIAKPFTLDKLKETLERIFETSTASH